MPDGNLQLSGQPSAPATISMTRRQIAPGPIVATPVTAHRIIVHLSPAARTRCRDTGLLHTRKRGHIDVVPSGAEGEYDAETAARALEIHLAPDFLDRIACDAGLSPGRRQLTTRHMMRNDTIFHLAQALGSDGVDGTPADLLRAEGIGIALVTQLLPLSARLDTARPGLSASQLRRVLDYIDAHLDQALTMDILAREAGASGSHLRHWFKAAMGTTLHRHVIRRRVDKAQELLLQGSLSASEIAFTCGFSHQSHMARWMRRELNYTPSTLRAGRD